jgi:membrane-associated phospholipid phosphatase
MWISLATFTSLARTYDDKHWFSDILTGAGIGYVVSSFNFSSDKDFNNYSFYLLPNEIGLILRL